MNVNELEQSLSQLKEEGKAPEWLTTEGYAVLSSGYLLDKEDPVDMYNRVASTVEELYPRLQGSRDAIFSVLWNGYIGLASPVASNFGTSPEDDRGLPISCHSGKVGNSVHNIKTKELEVALLSKLGGGTAISYDDIDGSTPVEVWAKGFDITAQQVSQGASRRGALAHYLRWDHPDILSFLAAKKPSGDHRTKLDGNIAITLDQEFWNRLFSGDTHCKSLFDEVLRLRLQVGNPYIIYLDNVQKQDPPEYEALGFKTIQSNLCCLSADTKVITQELGAVEIEKLIGKEVTIFDGMNWIKNSNWYRTEDKLRSYRLYLSNGETLDCTHNHRHHIVHQSGEPIVLETKDLYPGLAFRPWKDTQPVRLCRKELIEDMYGFCTQVPTTQSFALEVGDILTHNSEIFQHTSPEIGLFCALSSLNIAKYDEWKDLEFLVGDVNLTVPALGVLLLDAVVQEFIIKIESGKYAKELSPSLRAAKEGRAIGLGVMGFHTYLQKCGIPFGSLRARAFNKTLFSRIQQDCLEATHWLGEILAPCPWSLSTGGKPRRNIQVMSMAPTLTNSTITGGISPGIEPVAKNRYVYESAKGSFVRENPVLAYLIKAKGLDASEIWRKIQDRKGSIQGMSEFTLEEQKVFLTAFEIDQRDILTLAAERQPYVDQGQSLNLFISPDIEAEDMYRLHVEAWLRGIKSLYYVRSESPLVSKDILRGGGETNVSQEFIIYSREDCTYCQRAKQLLTSKGIPFVEIDQPTGKVPQIFNKDYLIGGYEDLVKLFGEGETADTDCPACEG